MRFSLFAIALAVSTAVLAAKPIMYTVTASAGPGGIISPLLKRDVKPKQLVNFGVSPSPGYKIKSVSGCGIKSIGRGSYQTEPVTANCAVRVAFEAVPPVQTYTITAKTDEGGTIAPQERRAIKAKETVDFIVEPGKGYKVRKVKGCGIKLVSGNQYQTAPVTSDCSVKASFEAAPGK